jgi:ComF family protein
MWIAYPQIINIYYRNTRPTKKIKRDRGLYHVYVVLSEILFPPTCVVCGSLGPRTCLGCSHIMRAIKENWCLTCGNILRNTKMCIYCEGKKETLPVLGCWYYESAVARAVWSFKYKRDKQILQELSSRIPPSALSELFAIKERNKDTVLVPVPLHKTREKERGFNQSCLFARFLGAITDIPTECGAIERVKKTKPQAKCKSKKERAQNIRGAFAVRESNLLHGKAIVLIDDVVTTGSTAREIVREIKKEAKLSEVIVFCLAREQDDNVEM